MNKEARKIGKYNHEKWDKFQILKSSFFDALDVVPYRLPKPKNIMTKFFVDRPTILKLYHRLKHNNERYIRDSEKWVVILMMGFLTGLRTNEIRLVEITDFSIDPESGLLKRDQKGYGRLFLPDYKSKGNFSPSPPWGTYIVPELVSLLNEYLLKIYEKFPHTKGKGYLLRPANLVYDRPYIDKAPLNAWISRLKKKNFFDDILTQNEIDSFHYYSTRHTVAELILRTPIDDLRLLQWRRRAAQVHIRHNMGLKTGQLIDTGYTREISEEDYFKIIDRALNFFWG